MHQLLDKTGLLSRSDMRLHVVGTGRDRNVKVMCELYADLS